MAAYICRYDSRSLVEMLNAASVPFGRIYSIDQVFADPQVKHIGMVVPMPHPTRAAAAVVGQAVVLSRAPSAVNQPTPELGQHLTDLGYTTDDIDALRCRGVI
jgi:crotonobetainyl-CoA:carnitine CoA-transferase CaiB-like acyl-CoA transferase